MHSVHDDLAVTGSARGVVPGGPPPRPSPQLGGRLASTDTPVTRVRRTTAAPAAGEGLTPPRDLALNQTELRGVLRLLHDAGQARDLPTFRRIVLRGLARHHGYQHSIFFVGTSMENAFRHPQAIGYGLQADVFESFIGRYHGLSTLCDLASMRTLAEQGIVGFEDVATSDRPEVAHGLEWFLRRHGFRSTMMVQLAGPATGAGVLFLFSQRPGGFGPRDHALAHVLRHHLGALLRFYVPAQRAPDSGAGHPTAVAEKLTSREREVVSLVAEGRTNREVAEELSISVDTVKHHLSHALLATGCTNRTRLAVAWQREAKAGRP
jgi:DNA-binding CsgD family transcriptional regulator